MLMNEIKTPFPVVWAVGGSDCTAGAGIQADLKTLHNLKVTPYTVITAVTAQNSQGVVSINPVPIRTIKEQIEVLLAESAMPSVIKIGLLATKEQVIWLSQFITEMKQKGNSTPLIVYDPVSVASNGHALTVKSIVDEVKCNLLPVVDVLTPNTIEINAITINAITSVGKPLSRQQTLEISESKAYFWKKLITQVKAIQQSGVKCIIAKGGHHDIGTQECIDYALDGNDEYYLSSPRLEVASNHGTGCTFASALSAFLAKGLHFREAFTLSKAYINQALRLGEKFAQHSVYSYLLPDNKHDFPTVIDHPLQATSFLNSISFHHFPQMMGRPIGLYPVVDSVEWCERLMLLGVNTIQYREKTLTGEALSRSIKHVIDLGKKYQCRVFINDYWSLAIQHGAYGVHLGQEDIDSADLHKIRQSGMKLGVSTHGYYEFLKARQIHPSYIAIGAIFPTYTKDMTGQIQGVQTLAAIHRLNRQYEHPIPIVAIGGINCDNVTFLVDVGIENVAVVSAITKATCYKTAVKRMTESLKTIPSNRWDYVDEYDEPLRC
ncbi:thiamine phosphate synthase [Vibrio sp.]|nr:thiamine phosphate synthase [Vibrio sp.]